MSRRADDGGEPDYLGRPERPQMLSKAVEALTTVGLTMEDLAQPTRLSESPLNAILGVERERVPKIGAELAGTSNSPVAVVTELFGVAAAAPPFACRLLSRDAQIRSNDRAGSSEHRRGSQHVPNLLEAVEDIIE